MCKTAVYISKCDTIKALQIFASCITAPCTPALARMFCLLSKSAKRFVQTVTRLLFLQTCYYCTLETVNQFSTFWPFNREQALHPDSMFVLSFIKFVKFSKIFLLCLFSWDIFKGYYRGIFSRNIPRDFFMGFFQGIFPWDFSKGFFHGIFQGIF